MDELPQIATATRWVGCPVYVDSGEGPHSSWKDLICGKRLGQLSSLIGIKVSGDLVAWCLNHLGMVGVMRISELKRG